MVKLHSKEVDGETFLFIDDKKVIRGWESFNGWYWFATEHTDTYDNELKLKDKRYFGYVQGLESEWGYFTEGQIEELGEKAWEIPKENLKNSGRRD